MLLLLQWWWWWKWQRRLWGVPGWGLVHILLLMLVRWLQVEAPHPYADATGPLTAHPHLLLL